MAPGVRYADRWLGRLGVYDHIIGVSHSATTAYESYPETYRKKIVRIDHGVATKRSALSRSAARAKLGLPLEKVLLGCAARLHPAKYLEAAIGLLPSEPTWRLALAGQGPDHERLKQVARDLGCEGRIHWLGELDPPGIGDFLAALDVFVFPSLTETFGLAAVEAAQAGVPVVANDLPVLREVLSVDGEPCAVFADSRKSDAFQAAVRGLVNDPRARENLGARGGRLAQRYPVESMVASYDQLVRHLVQKDHV